MPGIAESDLAKWLLCRLMVKQGYSETDVAKHMEENEALLCAHPILDDTIQNVKGVEPTSPAFLETP
jgi:hypothetical protein